MIEQTRVIFTVQYRGVSRISARGVLKVRSHTKSGGGGGGGGAIRFRSDTKSGGGGGGQFASGPIPKGGGGGGGGNSLQVRYEKWGGGGILLFGTKKILYR